MVPHVHNCTWCQYSSVTMCFNYTHKSPDIVPQVYIAYVAQTYLSCKIVSYQVLEALYLLVRYLLSYCTLDTSYQMASYLEFTIDPLTVHLSDFLVDNQYHLIVYFSIIKQLSCIKLIK